MSKIFILVGLLLLVILPKTAWAADIVVNLTDSGFSPTNISITQGEIVTFKNIGQNPHWPASDIHPTHAIYPQFDPKHELISGQNWQFRFDRVGSWRMHDHMNPEFTGLVTVKKSTNPSIWLQIGWNNLLDKVASWKDNLNLEFQVAYYHLFPNQLASRFNQANIMQLSSGDNTSDLKYWLKLEGSKNVMAKLLQDSGGGSEFDCHQQAHTVGRVAYQLFKQNAFKDGDSSCHSGFYHGAMEGFLQDKGTDNLAKNITNLCASFPTAFSKFECLHGVGHGVMAYEDYNLPFALDTCQLLKDGFATQSCYGGVFMENIITAEGLGAIKGHQTNWVSSDPYFPCDGVNQDRSIQGQCYLMQTSRMLDLSEYNFDTASTWCSQAPEQMRHTCFQSLGRDGAGNTLRDPGKIVSICQKAPEAFYSDCLIGALNVIIDFWGPNLANQPEALCQLQSADNKEKCYQALANRLTEIFGSDKSQIQKECGYFEESYQPTCFQTTAFANN